MCILKQPFVDFFPLQTANVAYFQRKIQLSGFSAYTDSSSSQLIRISGILLYILLTLNIFSHFATTTTWARAQLVKALRRNTGGSRLDYR